MGSSSHWGRLEVAFAEAATLHGDARHAYLDALQRDDPALHREVVSLLDAGERAEQVLGAVAGEAEPADDDILRGHRIGSWRLADRLGSGGMGAVYRAERADGDFRQTVALKLIKRGLDSEEILRRFRAERQILAGLEHPNIARLVDGGVTEEGRPWFAMEYVEGEPIDAWCDQRRYTVDQRLDLFLTVCDAVHYAEQRLVIHRDLKPGNILVTATGEVKLLDFGVAKVLAGEHESAEETELTRAGVRVMTPAYAAPEQVLGAQVSTATDAYQLGVILYELLTGRRPYGSVTSLRELEQAVLGTQPDRPSTVVMQPVPGAAPADAPFARRAAAADRLRRRLSGDLDNICLTALRKEPERRYASAGQLAEDVRRHRRGLPVNARPDTRAYRVEKFLVRHRGGVLGTAAAAILVTALTTGYLVRLQDERDRARVAEQGALEARDEANAVTEFLTGMLSAADPARQGRDVLVRDALDRAAATITDLSAQPLLEARVRQAIGRTYDGLGAYAEAEAQYLKSAEIRSVHPGARAADLLAGRVAMASLRANQGRYAEADSILTSALRDADDTLGTEHRVTLHAASQLGSVRARQGHVDQAIALLEESLPRMTAVLGSEDELTLSTTWLLGTAYQDAGRAAPAESLYQRALEAQRRVQGPESRDVLNSENSLAFLYTSTERYAEAEPLLRHLLDALTRRSGPDHPRTLVAANNLGDMYARSGRNEQALPIFRDVYERKRRVLGPDVPSTVLSMTNLGLLIAESGRLAEGAAVLSDAVAASRRAWPNGHWLIGAFQAEHAILLSRLGRRSAAETAGLESWQILADQPGPVAAKSRLKLATMLADLYQALGRTALAAEWRSRSQPAESRP